MIDPNTLEVEVVFSRKDIRKFFYLAVLANSVSYMAISAGAAYVLMKDRKQKAKEAKEKNNV